jgi:cytidyltransferase-like protein
MTTVFVSGCFDILHGGHVEFFSQAKALGDRLVVSFASDVVLVKTKGRRSSIPDEHKKRLIESLKMVDEVVIGNSTEVIGLDFIEHFNRVRPDILAATEDDRFAEIKTALCESCGWPCSYVRLPKTLNFAAISTTEILQWIKSPKEVPLRIDIAGGWLDLPSMAIAGSYIVNCSITPKVSLADWRYEIGGGLGGSAACALLSGKNPVESELGIGVGWQDPAVIMETGLCVWRSGDRPVLDIKVNPEILAGKMALLWTGAPHNTPMNASKSRDYSIISDAGYQAAISVRGSNLNGILKAVRMSYEAQIREGMRPLPSYYECAKKYAGGGWGGYAVYFFDNRTSRDSFVSSIEGSVSIEPYISQY